MKRESPDFSSIRSETERADAERSYELGCDIAEAVADVGDIVGRALERVSKVIARKPIANW